MKYKKKKAEENRFDPGTLIPNFLKPVYVEFPQFTFIHGNHERCVAVTYIRTAFNLIALIRVYQLDKKHVVTSDQAAAERDLAVVKACEVLFRRSVDVSKIAARNGGRY